MDICTDFVMFHTLPSDLLHIFVTTLAPSVTFRGGGGGGGGMGMCHSNGLLFHKKSLNMGLIFVLPELSSVRDYVITHSVRSV